MRASYSGPTSKVSSAALIVVNADAVEVATAAADDPAVSKSTSLKAYAIDKTKLGTRRVGIIFHTDS